MAKHELFEILSKDELENIHDNSLRIMKEIGISVRFEEVREMFRNAGAKVDGEMVYFDRPMVEKYLAMMPSSFKLHARNPENDVVIDTYNSVYMTANCSPFVQNLDDGRHMGTIKDFDNLAKLTQDLKHIQLVAQTLCEPCDLDVNIRHLEMTMSTLKYANKPFMGSCEGLRRSTECVELAAIPFGGLDAIYDKPIMFSIPCTITPLGWDQDMLEGVMTMVKYGQPVMVNALAMAGATSPITLAGTLSVSHAEIMAGLVLTQIMREGAPVIYSTGTAITDMRYMMMSHGSPETTLFSMANCQLAHMLNIPVRTSAGLTDSKCVDVQAGYESMMNQLGAALAGANFQEHAAGIIDTYNTTSYEKLILDDEMIGYVERIRRGINVNEDTLAFDVIEEEEPRGNFIASEHTVEFMDEEIYKPIIGHRDSYVAWENAGKVDGEHKANQVWHKMLDEYEPYPLDAEVEKDMRKYIDKCYDGYGVAHRA